MTPFWQNLRDQPAAMSGTGCDSVHASTLNAGIDCHFCYLQAKYGTVHSAMIHHNSLIALLQKAQT